MNEHEKPQIDFMHKLARQIVERRNLVFLFVILAAIFTVFSVRWVKVETDMTTYLPKTSETRMGLDIMDEQFTTYGSADVMVANITPAEADELSDRLTELKASRCWTTTPRPTIIIRTQCRPFTPSPSTTPRTMTSASRPSTG